MRVHFNIKSRMFRMFLYIGAMAHVRHWRGHGIHSPFVYSLIRKVFMKSYFLTNERALYAELRQHKVSRRAARQLQNMHNYCKYNSYAVLDSEQISACEANFRLLMPTLGLDRTKDEIEGAPSKGYVIALIHPRQSRARNKFCKQIVASERCLSIDNRRYILLFHDHKLPRQHFKL